jgi:hypothetical protein
MTRKARPAFTAPAGSILQVKMRLLDISPMIWRRVLVPIASTLQELRGVIQAAMGWEGLHLHEFRVRSARYGSPELCAGPADVTLESLRFRRNAKLVYVDDMGIGGRTRSASRTGSRPRKANATPSAWAGKAPARQRTAVVLRATRPVARRPWASRRSTISTPSKLASIPRRE